MVLIGDIPRYEVSPEDCVYGNSIEFLSKFCSIKRSEFQQQRDIYEQTLVNLADKFGVQYATIYGPLCNKATCSMVKDDFVLYRDDNHLNIRGSQIVGRYLGSKLSGGSNPGRANH